MASDAVRRPLPALISLAALLVLTALVWWRVINRDGGSTADAAGHHCTTSSTSAAPHPSPTITLPAPSTVRVLVLNSTSRTGIAGKARTALVRAGFASPAQAANFTGKAKITGVGQIRYPAASRAAARLVAFYVPGAKLVPVKKKSASVTVVLGPRYRAVSSAAEAGAALAEQRATVSAAPSPAGSSPASPAATRTSSHC